MQTLKGREEELWCFFGTAPYLWSNTDTWAERTEDQHCLSKSCTESQLASLCEYTPNMITECQKRGAEDMDEM